MPIFNVTDEDLIRERRPGGTSVWRFYGTEGNDTIILNTSVPAVVIPGAGRDSVTKVPGSASMLAYGDNAQKGFNADAIGPRNVAGNDRLEIGAGDMAKSGGGQDFYGLHGLGESYDRLGPAQLWIDIRHDTLNAAGDQGFRVTDIDFFSIASGGGSKSGTVRSVTVKFQSANRLVDGQTAELLIGIEREGPRPNHVIEWDRGETAKAAMHAYLEDADFLAI